MTLKVAMVADTHFGWRGGPETQMEQLLGALTANTPDIVIHLGDVVEGGKAGRNLGFYPTFAAGLNDLHVPILRTPGNHDKRSSLKQYIPKPEGAEPLASNHFTYSFAFKGYTFLMIDGLAGVAKGKGNQKGQQRANPFSAECKWIEKKLEAAPAGPPSVIVCCHFPLLRQFFGEELSGGRGILEILDRHQAKILGFYHGHTHRPGVTGRGESGVTFISVHPGGSFYYSPKETNLPERPNALSHTHFVPRPWTSDPVLKLTLPVRPRS